MLTLLHNFSPTDGTLAVAICAVVRIVVRPLTTRLNYLVSQVTHLVFNRFEPSELPAVAALLVGLPTALSSLFTRHYGIVGGIALAFAVFHATLTTSVIIYRISPFHPLARYPGPPLARLTRWYWALIAIRGHQHTEIQRMHDIYGDAVRYGESRMYGPQPTLYSHFEGPNELSFRDVSLIQPMMGAQGMPKGPSEFRRLFKRGVSWVLI